MLKGLVVAACVSVGFMWTVSASARPIVDTPDDVTEISGFIIPGHEDAIILYDPAPTVEVTTLTGYTVPGHYDQFYVPTDGEIMAGNDCTFADDIDELLFALILELDDLWLFLA